MAMKIALLIASLVVSGAGAAAAASEPKAATGEDKVSSRIICRTQGLTGSRLGSQRVCMTVAQWAEHKRVTRDTLDRAQTQQINRMPVDPVQ
jgi:hypothetical protein